MLPDCDERFDYALMFFLEDYEYVLGAVNNWRKRLHYDAIAKTVSVDCLNMCRSRFRGLDFLSGSTIFLPSVD